MLNKVELGLIALVRSAMTEQYIPMPEGSSLSAIMPMAKKHQIAPMLMQALTYQTGSDAQMCRMQLLQSSAMSLSVSAETASFGTPKSSDDASISLSFGRQV